MVQNITLQEDTHYAHSKAYFHHKLKEIEDGEDELLNQEDYYKKITIKMEIKYV